MSAFAVLAEAVVFEEHDVPSKWYFGAAALVVFLLLLWIVTRINIDR